MTERVGVPVEPVDNPQAAAETDNVITATNAYEPVLEGAWLKQGAHLNAIGSNSLLRREIDLDAVRKADAIVVDDREQTALESGDLHEAIERGIVDLARLPELGDIVAGRETVRHSNNDITLFESHGIGLWDVALATHVYKAAIAQGREPKPTYRTGRVPARTPSPRPFESPAPPPNPPPPPNSPRPLRIPRAPFEFPAPPSNSPRPLRIPRAPFEFPAPLRNPPRRRGATF